MSNFQRKFDEWVGLGGPRPSDVDIAHYLQDYISNREDSIDAVDAAVIREAVTIILAAWATNLAADLVAAGESEYAAPEAAE